ncbi:Creatinase/aminopeptidase [Auriculariales sp. MPI-PUGE-AT-0066]|nr:Creatinase/aminopeptidase [Auriculariales sp. MPI-PUGE-AT-0066]
MSSSCLPFSLFTRRTQACDDTTSTLVESHGRDVDKKWPLSELDDSSDAAERLARLRSALAEAKLDAYIILSADAHGSEYLATCDRQRAWISGFTGSAGTAVVTSTEAHLFADSRYWTQASRQLSSDWTLHRVGETPDVHNWNKWILTLPKGTSIGVDARTIPFSVATALNKEIEQAGLKLTATEGNLVDSIWERRPARPHTDLYVQTIEYTGRDTADKLADFRKFIAAQADGKAAGALLNNLSEIAWLVNLRGSDIANVPFFFAYLFVSKSDEPKSTVLFTGPGNVDNSVKAYLNDRDIDLVEYDGVWSWLSAKDFGDSKLLLSNSIPFAVTELLGNERYAFTHNWVADACALKNEVELAGFEKAYLRDGVAFVRLLAWLEEQLHHGKEIDEWGSSEKLEEFREQLPHYKGPAYNTIAGSGPNGALPHYEPSPVASRIIDRETPFVIDAGGQWLDGTCDTTRTLHFGRPTHEQREAFTRVLQGHIAVDSVVFPAGTDGRQLDVLARSHLWHAGLDYGHGTGHGFGAFLSVHEGPQGLGAGGTVPFKVGHVLTNEPGYYKEGHFGIRTESAGQFISVSPPASKPGSSWIAFQRFTRVPIQAKLVDSKLFTLKEAEWLYEHNQLVYKDVLPHLKHDKRAAAWLKRERDAAKSLLHHKKGFCLRLACSW